MVEIHKTRRQRITIIVYTTEGGGAKERIAVGLLLTGAGGDVRLVDRRLRVGTISLSLMSRFPNPKLLCFFAVIFPEPSIRWESCNELAFQPY